MKFYMCGLAAGIWISTCATAFACSPSSVRANFDSSESALRRLSRSDTVDDAQWAARRAQNELENLEISLRYCNRCSLAASDIDDAARYARRAKNDDDPNEIMDYIRRSIRAFNSAASNIAYCLS